MNIPLKELEALVKRLEQADLLELEYMDNVVMSLPDRVLSFAIQKLHYIEETKGEDWKTMPEEIRIKIEKRLRLNERKLHHIDKRTSSLEKQVRTVQGGISQIKGTQAEFKIKEMIRKGEGVLAGLKVKDIGNEQINLPNGKGYQIDLWGWIAQNGLKSASGNGNSKKSILCVEVKDKAGKVNITEAKKFAEGIMALKKEKRAREVKAFFFSKAGYTQGAAQYLRECGSAGLGWR